MRWKYHIDKRAISDLEKLGTPAAERIFSYLEKRMATDTDPRRFGKPLKGGLKGLWRYRVGDYRIISQIKDDEMMVLIIKVGHRRNIYG
ncbi:type II toxin-antitoxin system RelE/ParE family toxin [Ruficoccus amylovorans]|uniref:Type II toxin-antitoxin system RelE/ParE family toxin n=2 Tax=Ruficoccus amylovorans TaxID=1804625 RepID=A0A842HKA8_9BACT|nr:type II toxin-antitoxin system RelE/ParE family toxin [Ruficoccus amylovorans]